MNNKLPMIFYVKIFRNLRHINQDTPHSSGLRYFIIKSERMPNTIKAMQIGISGISL